MRKMIILLANLLIINSNCFSQDLTNNNWFFGEYAGINFSTFPPSLNLDSSMTQLEGCATASNKSTGELMFYTNGVKIWDKNHNIMPNSQNLTGSNSSSQSGLIVPKPGSNTLFYVFTTPQYENNPTTLFSYSVVDMTLNQGNGDVVSLQKNIPILNEFGQPFNLRTEAMTSVKNLDETKYWILFPNNNKLYSYLLGPEGFEPNPIISTLTFTGDQFITSCVKLSNDTKKIAISNFFGNSSGKQTRVYNFNNFTGKVDLTYQFQINNKSIYSLEFAFRKFLYLNNTIGSGSVGKIIKLDLDTSTTTEFTNIPINMGAFQLAPNGRIYVAQAGSYYLHELTDNGLTLNTLSISGGLIGTRAGYGLPQLIKNLNPCLNELVLSFPEFQNHVYKTSTEITLKENYQLIQNLDVTLSSTIISILNNTHIKNGSVFLAKVDPCVSSFSNRLTDSVNKQTDIFPSIDLLIFPNPIIDGIMHINSNTENIKNIVIFDFMGSEVLNTAITGKFLNISNLKNGIYIVKVTENGKTNTVKVVLQ